MWRHSLAILSAHLYVYANECWCVCAWASESVWEIGSAKHTTSVCNCGKPTSPIRFANFKENEIYTPPLSNGKVNEKELQPKIHLRSMGTKWKLDLRRQRHENSIRLLILLVWCVCGFCFGFWQPPKSNGENIPFVFPNEHKYELTDARPKTVPWIVECIMANLSGISSQRAKRYHATTNNVLVFHLTRDSIVTD